jgi:hypothetical protein
MRILSSLVAHDRPVRDSDQNNSAWFGLSFLALKAFHRSKFLRSPPLIGEANISFYSVRYAVYVGWKDGRNRVVLPQIQEVVPLENEIGKGKKETLPGLE